MQVHPIDGAVMRSHPVLRASSRLAILAIAALPLVAARCDRGDSGPTQVRENAFTWQGVIAPGNAIRVRELRGGIEVVPSKDDTARVTARLEWRRGGPDDVSLSGSSLDGDLLVCAMWGSGGSCTKEDYNAQLRGGRGRSDVKVFFRVEAPRGVEIDLVVIDGDLRVAASAPVLARAVNGDIIVATAVGPVEAKTLNGDVDIRMSTLAGTDTVLAETMNGDAFIYLPATVDANVEVSSTVGSASTDFPNLSFGSGTKQFSARLGLGTHAVRAKTINGAAALRQLDASGRAGGGSSGR
jgi:hypothetical protein